jgi:hypothetical protein
MVADGLGAVVGEVVGREAGVAAIDAALLGAAGDGEVGVAQEESTRTAATTLAPRRWEGLGRAKPRARSGSMVGGG